MIRRRSTWLLVVGGLLAGSTGAQREGRPAQDEEGGGTGGPLMVTHIGRVADSGIAIFIGTERVRKDLL